MLIAVVVAKFREQPRLNAALAVACTGLIVLAYLAVGPASQSSGQATRTATVQRGVVQSSVSGSGNIQAASQLNLGFRTGGTVTHIYVQSGQHVTQGQLVATLDPQSAEVVLGQARASLQSAEASLVGEEESGGETSSSPSSSATGASATTTTSLPTSSGSVNGASSGASPSGASSSSGSTQSAATREANLASARATVKSDQLTVQNDEKAVSDTKLYAPEDGTIVALSGAVGETVSGTGTTKASTSSSSASSSGGGASAGGAAGSATAASSSSGASSSATPFAVLSKLESMQLVVPLSEAEIDSVKRGQIATVTVEALSGRKVGAHVLSIDQLPTSSSGVVSYDVAFQLDQGASGVKTGMSATAEVVVKQEEGLNVPSSAVSRGSVTVVRGAKHMTQQVTTGLAGNSTTIILSGLKAGEEVVLPTVTSTASGATTRTRAGAAGGVGGGFPGGGFGGGFGGGAAPGGKGGG